jgi:hypothetical protein
VRALDGELQLRLHLHHLSLQLISLPSTFKMPPKSSQRVKTKAAEVHGYEFGGPSVYVPPGFFDNPTDNQ